MSLYTSLLHLIDSERWNDLTTGELGLYAEEWLAMYKSGVPIMTEKFSSEEQLNQAISNLRANLDVYKSIMNHQEILTFLEIGEMSTNLPEELADFVNKTDSIWFKKLLSSKIVEIWNESFKEVGVKSTERLKQLKLIYNVLPSRYQESISTELSSKISSTIKSLYNEIPIDISSRHYIKTIELLPVDRNLHLKKEYGELLKHFVQENYNRVINGETDSKMTDGVTRAADLASEILIDSEMMKTHKELLRISKRQGKTKYSSKDILIAIGKVILGILLVAAIIKGCNIIKAETKSDVEKYNEYLEKSTAYQNNRILSKKNLEQRKTTQIVETFQYGEKNNVPLFHTYIQCNKFLGVNEIDNELYNLKKYINTDSIDTDELYVQAHFFTSEKDKPYRTILAQYSNLKSGVIKYKQVTKPRATKSFNISDPTIEGPYKLAIEVEESYKSGMIEVTLYDLYINPEQDKVEIYVYEPMPSLVQEMSLQEFANADVPGFQKEPMYVTKLVDAIYHLHDDVKMIYRNPISINEFAYLKNQKKYSANHNWELTLSDDLAFVRIRSEELGGYYLIDRENERIVQAKTSFADSDGVQRNYLIQYQKSYEELQ